ncbi:MAG: hypothetical protein ACT4NL_16865, partial [Pseudomarimonas sp.]
AVRQRVIANLGRLDRLEPSHLDPLINGLNRALGRTEPVAVSVGSMGSESLISDRFPLGPFA